MQRNLDDELRANPEQRALVERGLMRDLARDEAALRFADAALRRFDRGALTPKEREILGEDRERYLEFLEFCKMEYAETFRAAQHLGSLPD